MYDVSPKFLLILLLSILVCVHQGAFAKTKGRSKLKITQLKNESPVYQYPSFDSPVKHFLSKGKKIRYFPKRYKGPDGFGIFYRVKLGKKGYGYVVEDDIKLPKESSSASSDGDAWGPFKIPPFDEGKENMGPGVHLSRYVGLSYSRINYSETLKGRTFSIMTDFVGLKFSGSEMLIGAPIDVNIMFLSGTPLYYKTFSSATTGFLLLSDVVFIFPLMEWKQLLSYSGVGVLVNYSRYKVKVKDLIWSSQEARIGLSFPLGVAIKLGKVFVLKTEAKYYLEAKRYPGFQVGLQMIY